MQTCSFTSHAFSMAAAQMMKRSLSPPSNPRPAPAKMAADWASLPGDLIRRLAYSFLAADDLDYYMDFRAVCQSWRSMTDDPRTDGTDPRFHPKNWAMFYKIDEPNGDVIVSFVNLGTGWFLSKNIPKLSNKYILLATTDEGLFVLWELQPPQGVRVLNPFTGSVVARFSVPLLGYDIRKVVVTMSPTMLFISVARNNMVGWADLNSIGFNEFWVQHPEDLLCMTPFAGDVYMTCRHGSITSSTAIVAGKERSAGTITMTTAIPAPVEGGAYYLVESEGDLLLVRLRGTVLSTAGGLFVAIHKVDTVRRMLEPVESIGSRAIFVSTIRCISVDANMFPTVEAGCVYFVEPILNSANEFGTVISSHRLGYQRHETIVEWGEGAGRQIGPSTLVQVLGDYCMFVPQVSDEPDMMLDNDGDFFDEDGGEDDSEGYSGSEETA